jgi:hypothetical protein
VLGSIHSEVTIMTNRFSIAAMSLVLAALVCYTFAGAQPPRQPPPQQAPGRNSASLDERVVALERGLASLSTRFELRDTAVPSAPGGALEPRIAALERDLERLVVDLQRVEREVDNAYREASDARREAMNAERAARDAAMRAR